MSPPGRPKGEYRRAQPEGSPVSPPGRPKGEYRRAQPEGRPVSPPAHLVLCTEADSEVGMGHAVRCAGLLQAVTLPHTLSVVGGGPVLASLFPDARHRSAPDWRHLDWAALDLPHIDLVLADIPFYRPRDWHRLRCPGAPLVVIDDHGGEVPADVVINGSVLPQYQCYDTPAPGRLLAGPDWALIRPEFAATPWVGPAAKAVTIVVGSGGAARDWALALADGGAAAFTGQPVQIVVGRTFDAMDRLRARCDAGGITLLSGLSATELAGLLAGSAASLITGGMVLYEAVSVGVPVVVYPQIPDLTGEAAWFAERGACIDLGLAQGTPDAAAQAVQSLLIKPETARAMSVRQRALLDGQGIARAATLITHLMETRS